MRLPPLCLVFIASEKHMKNAVFLAALILSMATPETSLAMISVGNVSKERAEELGIELRAKPNGPDEAWVELEFRPDGKLAGFNHVSLEIADGEQFQLGWTALKEERTHSGSVVVRLMGNRAFLEKVTLRVVLGALGEEGLDLRVRDFINLKGLR